MLIVTVCPLFSLTQEAQRKKLGKKEMPQKEFRSLRRATNAPRVGSAPPFEKGGRKLLRRHRREVTDKSKFEYHRIFSSFVEKIFFCSFFEKTLDSYDIL